MTSLNAQRPPLPPFTRETAIEKVRLAENGWNTRDPDKVALAYTVDSWWRNRAEFAQGRPAIVEFLTRKWKREVNAWDNALFAKTVRDTGKKTLIIVGVWSSVCVMFPALDTKAAGFKVQAVMDASGDPSELASRTTLALHSGGRRPDHCQCGHLRTAQNLEPTRCAAIRRIAHSRIAEVRRCHGERSESTSGRSTKDGLLEFSKS